MRAGDAKLIVDDITYKILDLDFGLHRNVNLSGRPVGGHQGGRFNIKIESTAQTDLYRWLAEIEMKEHVRIEIYPLEMNTNMRTIDLYDVICYSYHEYFESTGPAPFVSHLKLVSATIVDRGAKIFERNWKRTNWQNTDSGNEHTPIQEEEPEPTIVSNTFTDLNRNELLQIIAGQKILLILKTENYIGETINLDLSSDRFDYLYNGSFLHDDILSNVEITSNTMEFELTVVKNR